MFSLFLYPFSLSCSLLLCVTYLPANLLPVEGGTLALQLAGRAIKTRKPRTRRAPFTLDRRSQPRRYELSQPPENATRSYVFSLARAGRNVKRAMAYLKFHGCVCTRVTVVLPREPRTGRRSTTKWTGKKTTKIFLRI